MMDTSPDSVNGLATDSASIQDPVSPSQPISGQHVLSSSEQVTEVPGVSASTTEAVNGLPSPSEPFSDTDVAIVETVNGHSSSSASFDTDSDSDSSSSSVEMVEMTGPAFEQTRPIVVYTSSSSSSDDEDEDILQKLKAQRSNKVKIAAQKAREKPPTTEGEILPENLPAIEELSLEAPREIELKPLGSVTSIVDALVVVQSLPGSPGLDCDSVIFREDRTALGKVFDLFGPVIAPYYSIRFNSQQHAIDCGIHVGMKVLYAPGIQDFSKFVLLQQLRKEKGSDASWRHDNEPPAGMVEYSDDETEKREKRKNRGNRNGEDSDTEDTPAPSQPPANRRKSSAKRFHPQPRPPRPPHPNPRPGNAWTPWSRPQLRLGDWRHRPPPPMAAWNRFPRPYAPPPGDRPWMAQPGWTRGGQPQWSSPAPPPVSPPVAPPAVNPSPAPPAPNNDDPQFRNLFNQYYDYYAKYYNNQKPV